VWDLNEFPYPWDDNSADEIIMRHVLEHIPDWWSAFKECARILKPGGELHIHVPDESSRTALCYRDHYHVFAQCSFHGIQGAAHGTSAWAETENDSIPLTMERYNQVPYPKYNWLTRLPWVLKFCANHMRNFIWEQQFHFRKIGEK
jgi:ubiquinone/menaquinone biosynthesis C-methylase UbiE